MFLIIIQSNEIAGSILSQKKCKKKYSYDHQFLLLLFCSYFLSHFQINNMSVEGMTTSKAMKILESTTDCLVLDVWRQASPFSSAGSSPTPILAGINSPLPEGIAVSSTMSKSDTLAVRSSSWETPSDASRSAGSSKNLRSSGSQTDSLDSPGPSPRKALRNQEPSDKVRHSLPMLDKAKEKVEKIFKSRNKSQERDKESEEKKDYNISHSSSSSTHYTGNQQNQNQQHKGVEDCGTQVNLLDVDDKEFSTNSYTSTSGRTGNSTHATISKANNTVADNLLSMESQASKAARKRELEFDMNSGTWPKVRNPQCPNPVEPPTYIFATGHKPPKERPSVKDLFDNSPDLNSSSRTLTMAGAGAGGGNIHHSSQNSDSSVKYATPTHGFTSSESQSSSSAFSPMSPSSFSSSTAHHQPSIPSSSSIHPVNNSLMQSLSSPVTSSSSPSSATSSSILTSAKSPSHFSVGIMHGPGPMVHNPSHALIPTNSRGGSAMMGGKQPTPAQIYGMIPSHKHHPNAYRGSLQSSNQAHHYHHVQPGGINPNNSSFPPELRFDAIPNVQRGHPSKVQQVIIM